MKFYEIRDEILKGVNIINIPLKVTFYARVSTDKDAQLNSLENQAYYYKNYIKQNSNWTYVEGYIDEGISGTTAQKRKNFLRMISDSKKGLFDLVITKEVSRFSRNLLDSIKYTQLLMTNNVGVYFQTNGINTYDPNSEFILNMMGSLAQEEVKRLSLRVKWGHKNAIERGRVLGNNSITGYIKDNAKLIVHEEEAKKIKLIFKLYATGKYGLSSLAIELYNRGIMNSNNNIYTKDTLKRIIKNPKYKGYYRGHTTEVIDYKTKKRQVIKPEKQVIFKDENIPNIVSVDLWDKANMILNSRSNTSKETKKNYGKYTYTSKIKCHDHQTFYQRIKGKNPKWACGKYIAYGNKMCKSPRLKEQDLNNIFIEILDKLIINKTKIILELINQYQNKRKDKIVNNKNIKNIIRVKKENLLDLYLNKFINKEEFIRKNNLLNEEMVSSKNGNENVDVYAIKEILKNYLDFSKHVDIYISEIIEEIVVKKINHQKNELYLKIHLKVPINQYSSSYKNNKINIDYTIC